MNSNELKKEIDSFFKRNDLDLTQYNVVTSRNQSVWGGEAEDISVTFSFHTKYPSEGVSAGRA